MKFEIQDDCVYKMFCAKCGLVYFSKGSDIQERKCPACQGGKPSEPDPTSPSELN